MVKSGKSHFMCSHCRKACFDSYKYNYTIRQHCPICSEVTPFKQTKVRDCTSEHCYHKLAQYMSQGSSADPSGWSRSSRGGSGYWQ